MDFQIAAVVLELLFIFVILAALCHQRERIGVAPVTMAYGTMMLFGVLMNAAEIYAPLPWGGVFNVAQTAVFLPLLAAFLMIYISLGVLKAQRLLLGIVVCFLLCIYFAMLMRMQCRHMAPGPLRDVVLLLLSNGTASVNLSAVSNLISLFTLPLLYSGSPRRIGRTLRIISAMLGALLLGAIPEIILYKINGNVGTFSWSSLLTLLAITPFPGVMLSFYLAMLEKDVNDSGNGTFDFVFAFFGSYSRVKELEADLNSWENRYHLILRHTAEVVVVTDENGRITEANIAAVKFFKVRSQDSLTGKNIFSLLGTMDPPFSLSDLNGEPQYFNCTISAGQDDQILSASLSPIRLKSRSLLVLIARDITEEVTLAREKEELTVQLMHSQRMESLGVLAGGIAHDFNNCIHAIMGHADVAEMLYVNDPEKVGNHLQKISSIAEKAGKLTSQLLGFARKGKYQVVDIDLKELLNECIGMLDPFRVGGVVFTSDFSSGELIVCGDQVQMQQVVLNLLINALDATAGNSGDRLIDLSAGPALTPPIGFAPPPDHPDASAGNYLYFAVRDNGSGMDEETRKKIFEPFFTTKPVGSGTGMGLAMVYGTVSHHRGWIQLESSPGKGTTFCVFLPGKDK